MFFIVLYDKIIIMKKKKIIALLVTYTLIITSLLGCGQAEPENASNEQATTEDKSANTDSGDIIIDPEAGISPYYKDPNSPDVQIGDSDSATADDYGDTDNSAVSDNSDGNLDDSDGYTNYIYGIDGMNEWDIKAAKTTERVDRDVFVSTYGSDDNPGTLDEPFATVQKGIDAVTPGHTVFIMSGIYSGQNILTLSGTPDSPVTICSTPESSVTIRLAYGESGAIFDLNGHDNVIIRGLTIGNSASDWVYGVLLHGGEENVTITNNDICNIFTTIGGTLGGAYAVLLYGEGRNEEETIKNISVDNNRIYNIYTGYCEALACSGNVSDVMITSNIIHDISNIGIDLYGNGGYCVDPSLDQPRNITVSNNDVYLCSSEYATCAGIYVDGARDCVITRNRVYENMYGIEIGCENRNDNYPVTNITVSENDIHDNHDCGISIGGYDEKLSGMVTNVVIDSNLINNNSSHAANSWNGEVNFEKCRDITFSNNEILHHDYDYPLIGCGKNSDYVKNVTFINNLYETSSPESIKFEFAGKSYTGITEWNKAMNATDITSRSTSK